MAGSLNVAIGPHRRFDWTEMSLADVKDVKNRLGGTVNDVVLATAAGALGHFLRERRTSTTGIGSASLELFGPLALELFGDEADGDKQEVGPYYAELAKRAV